MKEIKLADVSRYRGELMGIAIVFIILFHIPLDRSDMFFGLRRCGNIGVDMFLFLSGIGLWYSWTKQPSFKSFYKRRLLRIFPTWLVISSLYYLQHFDFATGDYVDLILDITINWGFWLHDEGTFWYVPAIMMLYLWAPLYMKLIQRHPVYRWLPVLMICWCCVVQWVIPIHQAVGHIEIFWSRVPIFFIGINIGELVRKDTRIEPSATRAIPPLCRAHDLYPAHHLTDPAAMRPVPSCSGMVQPHVHLPRRTESGDLSDSQSVCDAVSDTLSLRLLAHSPADHHPHPTPRLAPPSSNQAPQLLMTSLT